MAGDFIQRSRHGTVFYFRRRVPRDLRERLGRLHFYASLRTADLGEAKRRARMLAVTTDRLFTELRYMQGGNKDDDLSKTDYGLSVDWDAMGRPQIKVTDAKPGEEASAEDLAKRMLGVATLAKSPTATSATPTIAEAMAAVLADSGIKPSTAKEYRRAFEFFGEFAGGDTRLSDFPQERFAEFADHVARQSDWAPKTQAFYITSAQRLFSYYGSRNSAVPKITTAGLKPKREAPAGHDRAEYTVAELEILFRRVSEFRDSEPAKWWVTVACAFLGTRIEEIAQAHLDGDFFLDESSGIHYLQIDPIIRVKSEKNLLSPKSVKSKAGWRKVPIHPALVETGFIEYLNCERTAGAVTPFERCWPALRGGDGRVKHGQYISRWAGEMMDELVESGALGRRLAYFHSMRHTFVTLLGKANVSEEWRAALAGHQYGGMNAQVYNKAKQDVAITLPKIVNGLAPLTEAFSKVR